MTALDRIAFFLNRRDEVPNQELARDLADKEDLTAIREIAEGLKHKNPQVQSDCLKVLYEISYLKPELISAFTSDFLHLLHSRNNRLVWGAMIALAEVTPLQAEKIHAELDLVLKTFAAGSVITIDNSINNPLPPCCPLFGIPAGDLSSPHRTPSSYPSCGYPPPCRVYPSCGG